MQSRTQPRLKPLTAERETTFDEKFGDSEDELGDDEDSKGLIPEFPIDLRSKQTCFECVIHYLLVHF